MEKQSILIVDDEKNIRFTVSQALESKKVAVETAINGEEALEKLQNGEYGVVLLDLRMPGMDGMEVLRKIREDKPNTRVVIISAHGTIDKATEAMKLGAVDFVQKPFSPKEIRALVDKVLERDTLDTEAAATYEEYIEAAKKTISEGDLDKAAGFVKEAAKADPTKPEAQNLLGAILEMKGDWLAALKNYRAALALDPTYKPADQNVERIVAKHEKAKNINIGDEEADKRKGK